MKKSKNIFINLYNDHMIVFLSDKNQYFEIIVVGEYIYRDFVTGGKQIYDILVEQCIGMGIKSTEARFRDKTGLLLSCVINKTVQ